MSAQPADIGPRPKPTIRSVRASLPVEHRDAFQAEIEAAPWDQLGKTVADWDLIARALADPAIVATAKRIGEERAGRAEAPAVLSDDEVRALMPSLRP
ncbi:hypothetical protein [Actinacidiphila soli]|uniref:hypothetical protein n=1 Tax=Actinacidiphila soli TaxID=2487275 RepID=UPI000FC9D635|nr:hypothetical protein [Actinacidiphila soli]